jgi:hypothetical protein
MLGVLLDFLSSADYSLVDGNSSSARWKSVQGTPMSSIDFVRCEVLREVATRQAVAVGTLSEQFGSEGDIVLDSIMVASIIPTLQRSLGIKIDICDAQACRALTSLNLFCAFVTAQLPRE